MASNCQIPTPQAYVRQMLDYIDYSEAVSYTHLAPSRFPPLADISMSR